MRAHPLRPTLPCLLLFGLALPARPQAPPASPPEKSPDPYAAEPYVIQRMSTLYVMHADGTGYREQTLSVKIQSDAALRDVGVLNIPYSSQTERVEFNYVRVRRPDGTVLETPTADAIEEAAPVTREAPFYSDLKQKELPVRSLRVGDTIEWQARVVITSAIAPGQFWGQDTFTNQGIVLAEDTELRVPSTLHPIVWTNPKDGPAPTESTAGAEHIYRWTHSSLKPTVGPQAEADKKAEETRVLTPDEELDAEQGKLPSIAWTTFPDWAAVGAWYSNLATPRSVPDDAVKAKVAELTAGMVDDEQKARAIYAYVSSQVRYIGVAFGIGRFQPHPASDVLANQYGDCKDKHTLLAAMLSAAGLPASAVLIGAGVRFNPDVPSPSSFNHVITFTRINGQPIWLDATAEVAPWRVLSFEIRARSALVVPPAGTPAIDKTPADLPFYPTEEWTSTGSLDANGISDSNIQLVLHDDSELAVRSVLQQISPAQYTPFIQRLTGSLGYGGTPSNPRFTRATDRSQPLTITFDYHREKAGDWDHLRTIAQLLPVELPYVDPEKPPTSTLQLGVPRSITSHAKMKIPAGWGVELPEAIHAKSRYATLDTTFSYKDGAVLSERKVVVLISKVPVSEWKQYKMFQDDAGISGDSYIQLIRATTTHSSTEPIPPQPIVTVSNAQAAKLIDDARKAIDNKDTNGALKLLDQAKAINPTQRNLWGTYGYRAYQLAITTEAIEDYTKELEFHPDATWVYAPLAQQLYMANRKDEALAKMRAWVAAEPDDPEAAFKLMGFLIFQNQLKDAIAVGNTAIKTLPPDKPENADLAMSLAHALVLTGSPADAAPILVSVLKVATSIDTKNTAAYFLSEANLNLPEAETAERSVLEAFDAETTAWTLDEAPATLKQKTELLFDSWDTLGWILYQQGMYKQAHNYIEAAWRNLQHTTIGRHLGDIELAEGNPTDALRTYELTLATIPDHGKAPLSVENTAELEKIQAGIARCKMLGAKSNLKDARDALQKIRTLDLGEAEGRSGSAEYRLLISQGKLELAKPVADPILGADKHWSATAFSSLTPTGSKAKIVRFGYLNCLATTCEFVLEP